MKKKNTKEFIKILLLAVIVPLMLIYSIENLTQKLKGRDYDINIINCEKDTLPSIVDHSEFEILKADFKSPSQLTEACLTCHNKRDEEVMASSHWNWDRLVVRENGDTVRMGKKNMINNYCIATNTNTWKCTSCHAGYGYKDKNFDFKKAKNMDCIVCHDQTGAYDKQPLGSGFPVEKKRKFGAKTYFTPDYNYIGQNVGKPTINNCGKCHFFGGGGNNVKHGDLSDDLYHADKDMDVHMDENGNKMSCIDCHKTKRHEMKGKLYRTMPINKDRLYCYDCHTEAPHVDNTLNRHTNKISCQTCHIPIYAKGAPTKMSWDWSQAGKLNRRGYRYKEHDSLGKVSFKSEKGAFVWQRNVTPEYVWSNGNVEHYIYGDKIKDTSEILQINKIHGSYQDSSSKIIPVKVHRGKQIFDTEHQVLIPPHVYGDTKDAFKKGLDWKLSATAGMKEAGLEFSGNYSFISTEMHYPINHMVSPVEKSLKCIDCHSKNGRLENLKGFYMPGRDSNAIVDCLGILMVLGTIGGVLVHGLIRFFKK